MYHKLGVSVVGTIYPNRFSIALSSFLELSMKKSVPRALYKQWGTARPLICVDGVLAPMERRDVMARRDYPSYNCCDERLPIQQILYSFRFDASLQLCRTSTVLEAGFHHTLVSCWQPSSISGIRTSRRQCRHFEEDYNG